MSPIAVKTFRSTPTTYFLNGPTINYESQPSNLTISNSRNATFVGITSLVFPTTFPISPSGIVTYRWYDQFGPLSDLERNNGGSLGVTTIAGTATTTLTISNAISPSDNNRQFYLVSYFTPQNAVGFQTFASATNSPLTSSTAILTVRPYLSIITQPTQVTGSVEDSSTFNISANVSDASGSISYQWRLNGSNLSDGTSGDRTVSGSNSNSLTIRITTPGSYSIDCVVSHPNTDPGSLTSTSAVFTVQDNVRNLVLETMSLGSPGDWMGYPGGQTTNIADTNLVIRQENEKIYYVHAPDRDVEALVTLAAPAANGSGGQGGWMVFKYTFQRGIEHTFILQSRDGGGESRHPKADGSTGTIRGEKGAGGAFFYRLNQIMAVCGGGGGSSEGGAGGDGSGANIGSGTRRGQNGFGVNGGRGGEESPDNNSPGLVGVGELGDYWLSGVSDSSTISAISANDYNWVNTRWFTSSQEPPVKQLFGPAYAFGGQFLFVDYRSNRTEASRGSRAFVNPRGSIYWINYGLRENTNDCYRFTRYRTDTDGDTRNNKSLLSIADRKAGRTDPAGTGGFFDANDNLKVEFGWNPNTASTPFRIGTQIPNMYWNKIGNGIGQKPGRTVNFSGQICEVENVGGSDDFNSTQNGTTRRTHACCAKFYRDDPDDRMFVAPNTARIIRGFRVGYGARNNGGWSKFGGAGGGNGAQGGGSGAGAPHWSGGGGGSGWADGRCDVRLSVTGGNPGEAYVSIKAYNPNIDINLQLPSLPVSPNPSWQVLDWNDVRNFGWKRSSDGERWPRELTSSEISSGVQPGSQFFTASPSDGGGTYVQTPLVRKFNNNETIVSSGAVHLKGGLNEEISNFHRRFNTGAKSVADTGTLVDQAGSSGNLYFTSPITNGNPSGAGLTLWTPLRYNSLQGLEQVSFVEFELELPDFSAARFETYKGSSVYLNDNSPVPNSYEFNQQSTYGYTHNNPPSKYLGNDNGVRARWNPFTDKWSGGAPGKGSILYPSSARWTNNFNDAYIPFSATFELVLEFDDLLYHSDRSTAPDDIQTRFRRMIIRKEYDFGSPWRKHSVRFTSRDLWDSISGLSGTPQSRFYLPSADIYNYRNPRFTSWQIVQRRDHDTGAINSLNLWPVLRDMQPKDRPYARLEVGRGIFR